MTSAWVCSSVVLRFRTDRRTLWVWAKVKEEVVEGAEADFLIVLICWSTSLHTLCFQCLEGSVEIGSTQFQYYWVYGMAIVR